MADVFDEDIIPANDADRLDALHKYNILYTAPEEAFDTITSMMGTVFGTPLAFVSLVDKDTVFYKSQTGSFGRDRVGRKESLCSYTILGDDLLVVTNAREIAALKDTPYVAPEGGIRFYAGAPLITREGHHIGTACIVDTVPRTFTDQHRTLLFDFARLIMHEIEQRMVAVRQVELQTELSRAQTQLTTALKAGKVTTWHWDLTKNLIFGNSDLVEIFGLSQQDAEVGFATEKLLEAVYEEDRLGIAASLDHAFLTGQDYEAEYRIRRPAGAPIWVIARAQLVREGQAIRGLTGVIIDITDKKEIERDVQAKNEELRSLYEELKFVTDTIPQLAWATYPDGTSYFFNKLWLEYTGSTLEENCGFGWLGSVHPDDLASARACWEKAFRMGGGYESEYRLRSADGTYRWFLARGTPMKDNQGTILKWYGTTTDIQDHKAVHELLESRVVERTQDLQDANNHLKHLYSEMEQFAYASHHDLREPIRKILIFTQMIKEGSAHTLTERDTVRLEKVIATAQRMNMALSDILNYATLSKKEEYSWVDLNVVFDQIGIEQELYLTEKKAQLILGDLPALWAIPRQIHQLFYNLINNSLKYSRPELPPHILVNARRLTTEEISAYQRLMPGRAYCEVTVEDNGIGFEEAYADKIFKLFQRLHTREAYAGTGIGLAMAKKVVNTHGGSIWVKSVVNHGTTFGVILPIEPIPDSTDILLQSAGRQ